MTNEYLTDDIRIGSIKEVATPSQVLSELPITADVAETTLSARQQVDQILRGADDRLLVVVGPCSIHDADAAIEYAKGLKGLKQELEQELVIVMRVYFEKPRTTIGWKGLINDPDLDESFHINKGLRAARRLLLKLNEMGMPAGTEYLDLITPQYVADLIAWGAIGARTTESQVHREMVSGLSCPVGLKNGTDGTLKIAIDAVGAASKPHSFLSMTKEGHSAIFSTTGNPQCHIILRGGKKPNFDAESVDQACTELQNSGLAPQVMIDFSHANSQKQTRKQLQVGKNVAEQIALGDQRIIGVMIESNLVEGRQDVVPGKQLVYGQSITDACISWADTVPLLRQLAQAVGDRRQNSLRKFATE
ncbi:3-deoxy-7-phosphoheptulonate synthase AroG [Pseudomonadota bacterium]